MRTFKRERLDRVLLSIPRPYLRERDLEFFLGFPGGSY